MVTDESFSELLDEELKVIAFSSGVSSNSALAEYASKLLEEAGELASMEVASANLVVGPRRRKLRIDSFGYDELDNTLYLLAAESVENSGSESLTRTEADVIFAQLSWFLEVATQDSLRAELPSFESVSQFAWSIAESWSKVERVKLVLVTNKVLSERVRTYEAPQIEGKKVEAQIWDQTRLMDLIKSSSGREETNIELAEFGVPALDTLSATSQLEGTETFLTVMPGRTLALIFDKYGSRLLEGNVRGFLSVRGSVNKGIRATILGAPEKFLAFNNGLTATATSIGQDERGRLVSLQNLQIVNGGQTTASLYHFLKNEKQKLANLDKTSVAIKLIVVSQEYSDELVPEIARYSNSQNKVNDADFSANSPFHRRMEEISRRLLAPAIGGRQVSTKWYYERARGSFENERARAASSASALRKFDDVYPKSQRIDKTDLAKFHSIMSGRPHFARRGSQKNFQAFRDDVGPKWETEEGKAAFGDDYYKRIVCTKIMFDATHKLVRESSWYEQGYLADIVTYALSKFLFEIEASGKTMAWDLIWQHQSLPDVMKTSLLQASKLALSNLVNPTRKQQNVTEWAKAEECWSWLKQLDFELSDEVLEIMPSIEVARNQQKEHRERSKVLSELETLQYLGSIPVTYWDELLENSRLRISPTTRLLVIQAQNGQALLLDKRKASALMELIGAAHLEGVARPKV